MGLNERVLKSRGKSKSTPTVNESSPSTGRTSSGTETSGLSTGEVLRQLTLSVEDFLAKISPISTPKGKGLTGASLDYGASIEKLSTFSGHRGCSSKIQHPSVLRGFGQCSMILTRSGLMRNGIVFPLSPLAPLTLGIGRGLWRTPTAQDSKPACRREILEPATRKGKQWNLRGQATEISQLGTPLNPLFLEWLQGYPAGWTEIEPQGIASSRRSRNGSGGKS